MSLRFESVEDYIETVPRKVGLKLEKIRETIHKAVPDAEEFISYQMPAFKFHGMVVWFAAFKNHYSVFVRPRVMENFIKELKEYETTKSAIRIPIEKPVPVQLITKIVKLAAKQNLEAAEFKGKKVMKK
jgi:uncharacterized protein YdhG (YjbR/CyaY superfamily)